MERVFKQKRAADSFAKKARAKGYYAGVHEEPTNSQASTKRGRAQRRYVVRYETGGGIVSNSARRPTKLQRMVNASKRSKRKRVAESLKKFLHQTNPGAKLAGAKVEKLSGGVIKITPIKVNPRAGIYAKYVVYPGGVPFKSKAAAVKAARDGGASYVEHMDTHRVVWQRSGRR